MDLALALGVQFLNAFRRMGVALVLAALSLDASLAAAAGGKPASAADKVLQATVSAAIEDKVSEVLSRHVPRAEFDVAVTVAMPTSPKSLPYFPTGLDTDALLSKDLRSIVGLTEHVTVTLYLTKKVSAKSRQSLAKTLSQKLGLDTGRGDKLEFQDFSVDSDSAPSDLARTLAKTEADAREEHTRLEVLRRERDDLKHELTIKKALGDVPKVEKPAPESTRLADAVASAVSSLEANLATLRDRWTYVAAAAAVAFLLLMLTLVLLGRSIGGSVRAVAGALATLGEAVSRPSLDSASQKTIAIDAAGSAPQALPAAGGHALEALHQRLVGLHGELTASLTAPGEAHIVRHVSQLLAEPQTVAKAVAALELLGKEKANELFQRLSSDAQMSVLIFMESGSFGHSKAEVMLEAGEELLTKVLGSSLDRGQGPQSHLVLEQLTTSGTGELLQVMTTLDPLPLSRLLLLLEPARTAQMLSRLERLDQRAFGRCVEALSKLPEAHHEVALDQMVMSALTAATAKASEDAFRPFLKQYRGLLEAAGDDLGEKILKNLQVSAPTKAALEQSLVTLKDLFLLPAETASELVETLSNRDLAALNYFLKDEQKEALRALLPERRHSLIDDELETLSKRGRKQVTELFEAAKRGLLARVKLAKAELAGQDGISEESSSNGLSVKAA